MSDLINAQKKYLRQLFDSRKKKQLTEEIADSLLYRLNVHLLLIELGVLLLMLAAYFAAGFAVGKLLDVAPFRLGFVFIIVRIGWDLNFDETGKKLKVQVTEEVLKKAVDEAPAQWNAKE